MKVFRPAALGVGVRICGTGAYVPKRRVTNADLQALGAPLSPEEIVRLSGIEARHWADASEATSDLARAACAQAIERSLVAKDQIERLVLGTVSPDHASPSAACIVQHGLGLERVPAYDVTASCSGFLFALDAAVRAIATGEMYALAVAADIRSRSLSVKDRSTCALFGDGAGAVLLGRGPVGHGVVAIGLLTDGAGAKSVFVPAGGSREPASAESVASGRHFIHMAEGPQVYFTAVEGMLRTAQMLLAAEGLGFSDIDYVVPHQPNRRIIDRLAKLAGIPFSKFVVNIERYGNMSGASAAVAFDEVINTLRPKEGARILVVTAGAGYTAGAALVVV